MVIEAADMATAKAASKGSATFRRCQVGGLTGLAVLAAQKLLILACVQVGCLVGYLHAAVPGSPENLSLDRLFATAAILSWDARYTDRITRFEMTIRPLSPAVFSSRYVSPHSRLVTDVDGAARSYTLKGLLALTEYQVHLIAYNPEGMSNESSPVTFRTLEATTESSEVATVHVHPGEVMIVVLVLGAWFCAIGLFLHKWGKIRIVQNPQSRWKHAPKNIDTIKVVKRATDSVIHKNYSSTIKLTMQARQKRQLERMHTMPNIKVKCGDSSPSPTPPPQTTTNNNSTAHASSGGNTSAKASSPLDYKDLLKITDYRMPMLRENNKKKPFARRITSPVIEIDENLVDETTLAEKPFIEGATCLTSIKFTTSTEEPPLMGESTSTV